MQSSGSTKAFIKSTSHAFTQSVLRAVWVGKTGCAIAAVTDPGLAKAFVSALAQADPEQYSNTAAALAAKTISDKGTAQSSGGRHGKRRKQV